MTGHIEAYHDASAPGSVVRYKNKLGTLAHDLNLN